MRASPSAALPRGRRHWLGVAAALAAAPGPAAGQAQLDPSHLRPVAMTPIPLAEGIGEFERTCLGSNFDAGLFEASVDSSEWRYRRERGSGTPEPAMYVSSKAVLMFHGPPVQEARAFAPGQCNIQFVLDAEADRESIHAGLAGAIERAAALRPPRYDFPGETCFRWLDSAKIKRLCLMKWPGERSRQIALSFQLWTPEGETRAHLAPPR